MFNIVDFKELPETPIIERVERTKKGREYNVYKTSVIAGTVVHKNKDKNIVFVLSETGVIPVKFYEATYKKFDKKITKGEGKSKVVLDDSYFTRGTKLIINGYRKLDEFIPKASAYDSSPIIKIIGKENNKPLLQFEKMK